MGIRFGIIQQKSNVNPFVGLQNYWRMEDATDSKSTKNLTGSTVSYGAGFNNNCGIIGASGYWNASITTDTYFRNQTFSLGGWWYKHIGSNQYNIMWSHDFTSNANPYYAVHLRYYSGTLQFYINRAGTFRVVNYTIALTDDVWRHVIITVTTTGFKLYLNGALVGSDTTNTGNITYYNQVATIGRSPNFLSNAAGMKIDEWGYWTRELQQADISALYNGGTGLFF